MSHGTPRWKRWFSMISALVAVLISLVLLWPGFFGAPEVLADARFHAGIVALALAGVHFTGRARGFAVVVGACALVHLGPALALHVGGRVVEDTSSNRSSSWSMTISTCNLWYGNQDPSAFRGFADHQSPDVIALLEVSPLFHREIGAMKEMYPYQRFQQVALPTGKRTPFGMGVISKFPITEWNVVDEVEDALPYLRLTIEAEEFDVEVFVIHAMPPHRDGRARREYLAQLAEAVDIKRATCVVGDFNTTFYGRPLRELLSRAELHDGRDGFGRQPTWKPPFFPWFLGLDLDHILLSRHFGVVDHQVGRDIGSDHRPIMATIHWVP